MPFGNRRADLLERALQGDPGTGREVRELVATARLIPGLTSSALAPRAAFVSSLGLRLRAEALTLPARDTHLAPAGSPEAAEPEGRATGARRRGARPRVLVIGRGLPRVLAGATASLLLVGAVVGGTSRYALPGGLLYPVKQVLDSAAVQLAGSDFDRGQTWLSQAQEHISDAGSLVTRDGPRADPAPVDQALLSGYDAVVSGQRALLGEFDRTGNPQALIAVQDFAVRALPQLNALRQVVPEASRPGVDALIARVRQTRTTVARAIALCGQRCASLGGVGLPGSPPSGVVDDPTKGGGRTVPGLLSRGGLLGGPTAAVTRWAGPLGPAAPTLRVTAGVGPGAVPPPVTAGSITVRPPPVVIPPVASRLPQAQTTALTVPQPTVPGLPGLP